MSDPVTNLEIEDVLSSIRRLVAEGDKLRATPRSESASPVVLDAAQDAVVVSDEPLAEEQPEVAEAAEPEQQAQAPVEKFVLTSAFRVDEPPPSTVVLWDETSEDAAEADSLTDAEPVPDKDEADEAAALDADAPQSEEPEADPQEAQADMEQPAISDAEETAQDLDHEDVAPEPDLEGMVSEPDPEEPAAETLQSSQIGWDDDAETDRAAEADEMSASDLGIQAAETRSSLEATIAELEAAIKGTPDEWEPDGSEATPVMDWAAGIAEPAFLSSRQIGRAAEIEDAEEIPHDGSDSAAAEESQPSDAAFGGPEVEQTQTFAGSDPHALDGELDENLTAYLEEDEILDEETLRNLVVEIVRQELQGELGERITRNVRKLVRREIHRVLSSQEFD